MEANHTDSSVIAWRIARYLLYQRDDKLDSLIHSKLFAMAVTNVQNRSNELFPASIVFLGYFLSRADLYCVCQK